LIDSTAKKLADEFFEKFTSIVGPSAPAAPASMAPAQKKQAWFRRVFRRKDKRAAS
jgi:hypothetical protein